MAGDRYALIYADGIMSIGELQARLGCEENFHTLAEAEEGFKATVRETYREAIATDDGGPWAQVCPTSSWDGITYTDPGWQLTIGPRGGLRRQRY